MKKIIVAIIVGVAIVGALSIGLVAKAVAGNWTIAMFDENGNSVVSKDLTWDSFTRTLKVNGPIRSPGSYTHIKGGDGLNTIFLDSPKIGNIPAPLGALHIGGQLNQTTTIIFDANAIHQGVCIRLRDTNSQDGSLYTYLYANNGTLFTSTVSCQ